MLRDVVCEAMITLSTEATLDPQPCVTYYLDMASWDSNRTVPSHDTLAYNKMVGEADDVINGCMYRSTQKSKLSKVVGNR